MKIRHAVQIDRRNDIDVMQDERFIRIAAEKPARLFQTASGVQQDFFARDFNVHAEIVIGFQIIDNHAGKMMHIHNHVADAKCL